MRRGFLAILLALAVAVPAEARRGFAPASFAQPLQALRSVDMVVLPPVDVAALQAEDALAEASGFGGPARFAAAIPVSLGTARDGSWETLADGSRVWRLRVVSPGAFSLNFGFSRFHLPDGATVHFYPASSVPAQAGGVFANPSVSGGAGPGAAADAASMAWDGPYHAPDAGADGRFWTAVVPGDDAVIELWVPSGAAFEPDLVINQVDHDYRGFARLARVLLTGEAKQGTCNNDVICPEGDPWRSEIRSVGVYTLSGNWTCSGTLVNSYDANHPVYFLTANHCNVSDANAASIVVYWNFQSPVCGQLSGGSLAQHQTGAALKAKYVNSDFCLVQLAATPTAAYNVYYAGWDAREEPIPGSAVCIHHPSCKEKAISFCNKPLTMTTYLQTEVPGDGTHWRIETWDDGTTEPGSSGSGLWNPDHRLVGQLHGGYASCTSITSDYFGRLSRSWEGGGTAATRLRDWLDPAGTSARLLDGRNWDATTSVAGDADLNGVVNVQDLVAIVNHILGDAVLTGQGLLNADRNGDGTVNVVDLVAVVNIILQGEPLARAELGVLHDLLPPASRNAASRTSSAPATALGTLRLEAAFDADQRTLVFTKAAAPGGADDPAKSASDGGTAAVSFVLSVEPGTVAAGPIPIRFPGGAHWLGLTRASEDGTVRLVLFDQEGGASGLPASFALPIAGESGTVRFVEAEAADRSAAPVRVEATGFPVEVRPTGGDATSGRISLEVQPNPVLGPWKLRFILPHGADVALSVYDPAGRMVLERPLGRVSPGVVTTEFSASATGTLAPGVYFLRLTVDGRSRGTTRLVVAR